MYAYACAFLRDRVVAADVTQEVFLRLWQHRGEIDTGRVLGWLLHVTRNACIDVTRQQQSRRRVLDVDTDRLDRAAGSERSPAAAAEDADFQAHLERALDRLAEPYRSIVYLREVQEMKYEDISGALDLPLNTVKVYLHRARKMLRKQLAEVLNRETA